MIGLSKQPKFNKGVNNMKKFSRLFTVMMLVFMFSTTMVVSAKEGVTKPDPEEKFNAFITELEQKQTAKFEEANANWTEHQAKRQDRNDSFLEIVAQYAPELSTDFDVAFAQHDTLHANLFNSRTAIKTTFAQETITGLTALQSELYAQAQAGEITWKEARQGLKSYLTERKEDFTASKDAFKTTIAPAVADWDTKVVEIKALHQELKAAIADEDTETADDVINKLYDYLLQHIAFDQLKLDTLDLVF